MYPPLELIHKRYTLSFLSQTQVDVPSTCTTKDVPSNVLRQRSQAVKPLILCEWGYKRILRREREESKEFSNCVILNSLTREKGDTKEFRRRLVLGEFFLAKGEENEKMNSTNFSRFGKPENFRKLLVQKRRRSSKRFKACKGFQTQVDVPSTCITKDVPSNVLRQRSQAVKPLILCEWGYKRIFRRLGKGRIKRILRLCRFEFFDKGEGRHKRIQAVSPLFFWKREKRDTKRIQGLVLGEFFLAKG
ncbi:hypothetical protein HKD37_18G050633 [Glycine soja]